MRISKFLLAATAALVMASSAQAADVVYDEPAAPAPDVARYGWTGFYVGAFAAVGSGDLDYSGDYSLFNDDIIDAAGGVGLDGSGFIGGGQIGYNQQMGNVVLGAVADIAYSDFKDSVSGDVSDFGTVDARSKLKYLGTVRARLGYAVDRFLPYVHGGLAYGETEQSIGINGFDVSLGNNDTKYGYVVGAGLEYAVTDKISLQTEYSFNDLGEDSIYSGELVGGDRLTVDEKVKLHVVKAGINFHF